jgi:extracellular factor (EF) 3-hydroxypalmitic acid methyl ester biosynthesis protein
MYDSAQNSSERVDFGGLLSQLASFIEKCGPEAHEYVQISALFDKLCECRASENSQAIAELVQRSNGAFNTTKTNQGFVCIRPHGYHGDFEILDRIYKMQTSPDPMLERWDHYFHWCSGSRAVRARKDYCIRLFQEAIASRDRPTKILNVASGPGRDVFELLSGSSDDKTRGAKIHCVDQDSNAVEHAAQLLEPFLDQVSFENKNIFRCRLANDYDLVWSAGLFDYLEDDLFVRLLRKLSEAVSSGGELVVGNFSNQNTNRSYMEFGGWQLIHRDEDELLGLSNEAGIQGAAVRVDQEPNGINLFIRIRKL